MLSFWISVGISVMNMIATIAGFKSALSWYTCITVSPALTIPIALISMGILVTVWINSLMSNYGGMLIYWINLLIAPFGYHAFGLPFWLGITLAAAPLPFYFGVMYFSDWIDTRQKEKT
ncbi:hypothetical protein CDG61_16420 [Acinetobacter sp. WCHAc010052]|nr:hypothetical protein CDG61_16420 [Acinetobacter sp. WCHAc010052]